MNGHPRMRPDPVHRGEADTRMGVAPMPGESLGDGKGDDLTGHQHDLPFGGLELQWVAEGGRNKERYPTLSTKDRA